MSTISTSAIRRHIFHFVVLESNSSSIQINSKRKKKERKSARETSNDKKKEELRKRKKYYRKVCFKTTLFRFFKYRRSSWREISPVASLFMMMYIV